MANIAPQPKLQFFDANGHPLVGGKLYSYQAGTTTPLSTYTDSSGSTLNTNPIVLDSRGEASVWLGSQSYKLKLTTSTDVEVWTVDNISSAATLAQLAASGGAGLIGFIQDETDAVATTVLAKLQDYISVHDFMTEAQIADSQSGTPTLDMTSAIQAALDTCRSIYFPQGVYLTNPLLIPYEARGAIYFGDGFYHYTGTKKTVIKARTNGQSHIFRIGNSGASGADCLTFQQMRIECDDKASIGIDATYGAFFTMLDCGVYNYVSYGTYHKQGLARYDRVFMNTSPTTHPGAVGLHLYSDSAVTDSEFSGGGIPIKIVAGGNRLVDIWANTGAASCITLTPFDSSTTLINTSLVNIYAGEVVMTSGGVRPIIEMVGTGAQKVQEVQFSNSYLVTAAGDTYKKNGGIYMDYCDAVSISNIVIRGNGLGATADLYCDYFVKAQNSKTIAITGCSIKDVNHNPIYLVSAIDQPVVVSGCTFYNWGVGGVVTGAEAAAVRCETGTSANVNGCTFHIDTGSAVPYAVDCDSAGSVQLIGCTIGYANSTIVDAASGTPRYMVQRSGNIALRNVGVSDSVINSSTVNNAGQNYLQTGAVGSAGSGVAETLNLTTLSSVAEQQVYLVTVGQQGSGAHSAMYYVNVYGTNAAAVRVAGDDAVPGANAIQVQMSGLTIQAVVGSDYDVLTWRWAITRLI